MRRRPALVVTATFLLIQTADARQTAAWTPAMDARVAREALKLMPPSLRGLIQSHQFELSEGLRGAAGDESAPGHRLTAVQKAPNAAERVAEIVRETVTMVNSHRPFADVVRQMGVTAHFICDLDNPLHVSDSEPLAANYAGDYAEYVESNIPKFPLVFYGWPDPLLDAGNVEGFGRQAASRARRYAVHIGKAYAKNNAAPVAARFDVRSLPFGIGSLSYSRSVTDTARVWLHIWRQAHGDLSGTPYLAQPTAAASATAPGVKGRR